MFVLSKWYLDLTTDAGEVLIGHTGYFRWPSIYLNCSSVSRSSPGGSTIQSTSLRFNPEPVAGDRGVAWSHPALHVTGEWTPDSASLGETIYASIEGVVEWHCLMPRARVRTDQGLMGLGYVEHLWITVAPWKLPIDKLRWGRFLTDTMFVVWMDWLGPYHRRLVFRNGRKEHVRHMEDHRIEFEDGAVLRLQPARVLRSGPIGRTALQSIPGVHADCPARLLAIHETKWLSEGHYEASGEATQKGWALHKRALWPQ